MRKGQRKAMDRRQMRRKEGNKILSREKMMGCASRRRWGSGIARGEKIEDWEEEYEAR